MKIIISIICENSVYVPFNLTAEQALVTRKQIIPPGKIYAGVPSKELGDMQEKNRLEWTWAKQLYVDLAKQYQTDCSVIG